MVKSIRLFLYTYCIVSKSMASYIFTIVIPTYNEKNNIQPLLERIFSSLEGRNDYEILFVDDSDDETPSLISKYTERHSHVTLISRPKAERTGLGTAFVTGFSHAKGTYMVCMDADLQHPPEILPKLMNCIVESKTDVCVATRYAHGGSAHGLGSPYRKLVSKSTKYLCQCIFPTLLRTSDPGSGLFIVHKNLLAHTKLNPKGFKILIEILAKNTQATISEIPYAFQTREHDESKAGLKEGVNFLLLLAVLAYNNKQASRLFWFLLIGGTGTLINLFTLITLVEVAHLRPELSWFIATAISITTNFFGNTYVTFSERSVREVKTHFTRYLWYVLTSTTTLALNYLLYTSLLQLHVHYVLSAATGIIAATFLNYYLSNTVVWKARNTYDRTA